MREDVTRERLVEILNERLGESEECAVSTYVTSAPGFARDLRVYRAC